MAFYVVVGAGPVGTETARLLARRGDRVRLVSRRGLSANLPLVETIAADASDADRMIAVSAGVDAIFNCAMPRYDRWPEEFPPISRALLAAAEQNRARYLITGNLYGYGPIRDRMTEDLPMAPTTRKGRVRAQMWTDALESHRAGRVRATEVRASDYLGSGVVSIFTLMGASGILAGEVVNVPVNVDVPHSWTYAGDVARMLVAAVGNELAWGHAWHVPSETLSWRELSAQLAELAGAPPPQLRRMSRDELQRLADGDSLMNEFLEMLYLFDSPTVLDSSKTERVLGVSKTPLRQVLEEMVPQGAGRAHSAQ